MDPSQRGVAQLDLMKITTEQWKTAGVWILAIIFILLVLYFADMKDPKEFWY